MRRRLTGLERRQRVAERIDDQLTRDLELEGEMIQRKAAAQVSVDFPEGEISEGEIEKMDDEVFDALEEAPSRKSIAKPLSQDRYDLVTPIGENSMEMEDELNFEDGPKSSTDVSARLAHRTPAQTRLRNHGDSPDRSKRLRMPDPTSPTVSYDDDDTDNVDDMLSHFATVLVRPDCVGQQLHSCVANGKLYNDDEMKLLACMLSGVDITEVYSPVRFNKCCNKFGLPGDSFDFRDGYDLSDERTQAEVIRRIKQTDPKLVIGSPPCTLFSKIQALNIHVHGPAWEARFLVERETAVKHITFCIKLLRLQMQRGIFFLMEHPAYADTWKIPEVIEGFKLTDVDSVIGDQCLHGLKTRKSKAGEEVSAKKLTKCVSNSWCILQELSVRCDKSHAHQHLMGGSASHAQEYPDELCKAICRGLANQLKYNRSGRVCVNAMTSGDFNSFVEIAVDSPTPPKLMCSEIGVLHSVDGLVPDQMLASHRPDEPFSRGRNKTNPIQPSRFPSHWTDEKHGPDGTARSHLVTDDVRTQDSDAYFSVRVNDGANILDQELNSILERQFGDAYCWDVVTNAPLDVKLMRAARAIEMEFFEKMGVWAERLPRHVAKARGGKIIKGRWVDTDKGDSVCPDYRARFVAKEYNVGVDPTLYAATPPLEALKLLIAHAAGQKGKGVHIMISDVKRAYFNAKAQRELYVELPVEDAGYQEGYVGKLALALYGTRDAASLWQECLAEHLIECGFRRGRSNPCVFFHETRRIRTLVHGDDYASTGSLGDLKWLKSQLEGRFEMKTSIVGHSKSAGVVTEGKILNRIIRACDAGWEYECDQRHVEVMLEELDLMNAKAVVTPGTDDVASDDVDAGDIPLEPSRATRYRALSARANYIAVDRADAQYAIKELCREMSSPCEESWIKLERVARYLKGRPRAIIKFH